MINSRYQSARMQSDFYRDRYRFFLKLLLGSIIFMIFLCIADIFLAFTRKSLNYYAVTPEGQIIMLTPVVASK